MVYVPLRIVPEPPPDYVAFVARHLEALRRDAERVTRDKRGADRLYPEVLTAVAARWPWFELLRTRLHRPWAADVFLHHAFERRAQQWFTEQTWSTEIEVRPVVVWSGEARSAGWPYPPQSERRSVPPSARSNAALRLAPFVAAGPRIGFSPVAEAAVAWWHAYAAHRRRLNTARLAVGVLVFMALAGLSG